MRIRIDSLTCGYHESQPVLSDINLEFDSDDGLICIIGPNGVGKSTLVRCIDDLVRPTGGSVSLDGRDVRDIPRGELAERIGYVQTTSAPHGSMTVFETVSMGRYNRMGWRMRAEDLDVIDKAMSVMGLGPLGGRPADELSAGQFQKMMIARGLAQCTDVLILDEPTANLDLRAQMFVASLLRRLCRADNKLVLMICHDVNIAAKVADKILILAKPGRVLAFGTPAEVVNKENIREAYGVECDIVEHEGRPAVLIRSDSV
ncbi:MAG: ABC transporter ATP-binding protein [Candidatus Methanomethylophilaceae archaeon]|nr:ABC transporter ATP-binding protein [Candidatus Methanomethylophilaceae archaeon]